MFFYTHLHENKITEHIDYTFGINPLNANDQNGAAKKNQCLLYRFGQYNFSFSHCKTFLLVKQFRVGKIIGLGMDFKSCPNLTFSYCILIPRASPFFLFYLQSS
jgi:hypothetical protein